MNVSLFIAARYLFAKKSHNVINVISAICSVGMGVGTAALILIMSVYNGFEGLVSDNLSDIDPDILVSSAENRFFTPEDSVFDILEADPRVSSINCVLEDNIFFTYGDSQGVARARGVDYGYGEQSGIQKRVIEGEFSLYRGDVPMAAVGSTLAYSNGIRARFLNPLELYYPRPGGSVSLVNPASSLSNSRVWAGSLVSVSSTFDAQSMIVPLGTMQELMGSDELISGIELRLADASPASVRRYIRDSGLPEGYVLKDRYAQNPSLFRMMKYEKFAIFLILIFVVIIIAFNIFGSLSMLMIEKADDARTLSAMGATDSAIRRIFVAEGWMVSLLGMLGGLVVGVALAYLQQRFGFVKMPGGFTTDAYPVVLRWSDVLISCIGVALTGFLIALPASKARRD